MQLQKPFTGEYRISQEFGQNLNDFYRQEGRPGHGGIDFAMPNGTPILSPCDGEVIFTSDPATSQHTGYGVTVLSDEIFTYKGQPCRLSCLHAHLKEGSTVVKRGDRVKQGQLLALSNNTGQSTGPHLHFGVCPLEPATRREMALGEGYGGYTNPKPYLDLGTVEFEHKWKVSKERVKEFQKKHGLVADGIVGPKTHLVLDSLI